MAGCRPCPQAEVNFNLAPSASAPKRAIPLAVRGVHESFPESIQHKLAGRAVHTELSNTTVHSGLRTTVSHSCQLHAVLPKALG